MHVLFMVYMVFYDCRTSQVYHSKLSDINDTVNWQKSSK